MADHGLLIEKLNHDLAHELQAIIMYTVYSALVKGPYRPELVHFMQAEIPDELAHAQFLADKIVALGGMPTTLPASVPLAQDTQTMLMNILEAERQAIQNYATRAEQARALGHLGLAVQLEEMLRDETNHFEETQKLLDGWAQ